MGVTIKGESSGATSVAWHLTSRQSWPFFKRAILQSPGMDQDKNRSAAEANAHVILAKLRTCGVAYCAGPTGAYLEIKHQALDYDNFDVMNISTNMTDVEAKQWCDSRKSCNGFNWERYPYGQWTFVRNFTGTYAFWPQSPSSVAFMKAGPQDPSQQLA